MAIGIVEVFVQRTSFYNLSPSTEISGVSVFLYMQRKPFVSYLFLKEAVFLSTNTKRRANSKNLIPQDKKRFPTTLCMSWGSGTRRMVFIRDYQDDVLQLFLFLFDIKLWSCDTKCKMLQSRIDRRTPKTIKPHVYLQFNPKRPIFINLLLFNLFFFTYFNLCVCLIICIKIWIIVGNKSVEAKVFIFYPYRGFLNIMQPINCEQVITPNRFFFNCHLQMILMLLKTFVFKVRQFVVLKADETLLRNHLKPAKDTVA